MGGDYVLRCSVGLLHAYVCTGVSNGWLMGRKLCEPEWSVNSLIVHTRRLRAALDDEGCKILDGFLGMFALIVAYSLRKAPLLQKNHPYLEESMKHH